MFLNKIAISTRLFQTFILVYLVFSSLLGCSTTYQNEILATQRMHEPIPEVANFSEPGMDRARRMESSQPQSPSIHSQRMLIREGALELETDEFEKALKQIRNVVSEYRGYVTHESVDERHASMTMRVPAEQLDLCITAIEKVGRLKDRATGARDVTESYIDLKAQLNNLVALRDQYKSILKQAKNVKEILEVQKKITEVQTQIDRMTGRLKLMKSQVSYSRLHVSLSQSRKDGPVTLAFRGLYWAVEKLFVLN